MVEVTSDLYEGEGKDSWGEGFHNYWDSPARQEINNIEIDGETEENENKKPFIEHKIIEINNLNESFLKNSKLILPKIKEFIKEINLKVLAEKYHDFTPHGASLIFILSSSHLAVHTWPENNYLHIDLITCTKTCENSKLIKVASKIFDVEEKNIEVREIKMDKKDKIKLKMYDKDGNYRTYDGKKKNGQTARTITEIKTEKKQIKMKFKCDKCGEMIKQGMCGEHREETGHKEFSLMSEIKVKRGVNEKWQIQ